ncbi:amino acid adenylation domain-containing protein, partial [Kitasatospora sp. NPDC050463]|uniref:non-ribosomal peptide synthetase n=1 Tax=Kitasatospora sp. NPDC050463 TaxID=3155786 RepID=UPI0033CAE815
LITAVQPFALISEDDRTALPADVVDAYPLSQIQTGMLVELLAAQGGNTYHNLNSFLVPDEVPFDAEAFRHAVDTVVARHDILRTSMHLDGYSQPLQLVHATAEVPVTTHDLRGLTETEVAARQQEFMTSERALGFELTAAPLLRIAVHLESDRAWRLTFSHIHAVTEGWSYHTLVMEILACYRSLRNDEEPAAYEQPSVRYADFIAAEQDALADPQTQGFWQQLVDEHSPLVLPAPFGAPNATVEQLHAGVPYTDIEDGLRGLATQAKTSLKSVLLAAHLKVMGSLTSETAFHTGVVYHGRLEAPGADRVLGMHLNTLPFPASRGARTWRELVERTYTTETAIWSHRRYPLPAVQRAAGGSGDLVSVLFEYLDFHVVDETSVDVDGSMGDGANEFALNVIVRGGRVNLDSKSTAISRANLNSLAERYRLVLEAMAADPNGDATAAYLPEAERAQLTAWAAGDSVQWPTGTTLDLFEAQAQATADAVAVVAGDVRLTYREVDERANRIAHHLIGLGAAPDVLVGVCLERGVDLVPTLLGVWKAGAAYLPLDPSWPAERLAYVLADTATPAIVTSTALAATVGAQYDGTLVVIEREQATIDRHPATAPQRALDGQNLAYAIYTSGSTGRPKGVLAHHHGLVNYLNHTADIYAGAGTGGAPLFSSIAFDLGIPNLFTPLITGRHVTLLPDDLDTADLGTALARTGPHAFVKLTPGHLDLLTHQLTPAQAHDLAGIVIAAGDNFPLTLAQRWQDLAGPGGTRVATEYGPTEITIGNSGCPVDTTLALEAVPLGAPFPNTGMYVLTDDLTPAPVGVPGEVYIDGDGLTRGYHGRADLTAEKYLPNPYGPAGSRLYRTGDLARFLPDGTLETLGRIDNQVKIRGYRIELGEIEAALTELPEVRQSVVTVREGNGGEKMLVAYVVPTADAVIDTAALRAHLGVLLPEYMVPAAYLGIDTLPLTANGKVDTRALPAPDLDAFGTSGYTAPRTPLEERLAAIWAEVLGLPQVGVEDSFFDLGGDSIRAVRLVGALRAAGYDVSIRDVFQQRTIAALVTALPGTGTGESLITAVQPFAQIGEDDRNALPADVVDAYPLSQIQTGMLVEMLAAESRDVYQNINSFRLPDSTPFDAEAFRRAADIVVARHDILRTSMHLEGYSQPLQLVHAEVEIPVAIHDVRGLAEAEVTALTLAYVEQEHRNGFELTTAPLLRISVHVESDDAWRLTFSHIHAITEGWSYHTLLMELLACYRSLRDGREPAAYEVPSVRYADYIAAEQDALADPATQEFWQEIVATHSPLGLPDGFAESDPDAAAVDRNHVHVPFADLEDGLRKLAAEAKSSIKNVLLAAHLRVMSSLTADEAFHTGVVYHGRLEAPGADRVLGMHLNTLPFPTTRGSKTWRELVQRTHATETAIWSHRRYPLPAIQRAAGGNRDLLNVLFEYLDFHLVDKASVDVEGTMVDGTTEFGFSIITVGGKLDLAGATSVISLANLERLGAMYRLVLEAMAADPDGDATAAYLPEAERAQLTA